MQVPEGANPPPVSPQAQKVSEAALRWESCKFKSQSPRADLPAQGTGEEVVETGEESLAEVVEGARLEAGAVALALVSRCSHPSGFYRRPSPAWSGSSSASTGPRTPRRCGNQPGEQSRGGRVRLGCQRGLAQPVGRFGSSTALLTGALSGTQPICGHPEVGTLASMWA